ncbi:MAG TPA: SH3 domain-containing protein [Acidobacteriaceae bacterium]|nr:SH3 domain-containing protein [Acidobacteriaceae bacterium]
MAKTKVCYGELDRFRNFRGRPRCDYRAHMGRYLRGHHPRLYPDITAHPDCMSGERSSPMRQFPSVFRRYRQWSRTTAWLCVLSIAALCAGCSHFHARPSAQYVYVTARETSLRDRVAAVSNRVATVQNGDRLEVIEHGRHYVHVKTAAGQQGWISERAVATQEVYDGFQSLADEHKKAPTVATAVVNDEVNMHLKPGRETDALYRLPEKTKLQLLERATLPAPARPGATPAKAVGGSSEPPPIPMEDWWLARDDHGHTGWLLSRMIAVDAPDSLTRYAEGQRIVGAYVLTRVYDPEAGDDEPDKNIPVYLTVMSPWKSGLPYDFDQVRVFTWNVKMHRYETGFREKNIEGYLPVKIEMTKDPYGKSPTAQTPLPTFTYRVLAADASAPVPDPATGIITPGRTILKTYRLEGNLVRRVAPPGSKDEPEAHPAAEAKKAKAGVRKRR